MTQFAPPPPTLDYAAHNPSRDADHLKVLSICWYVWSGMIALFSCIPLIYVGLGIAILSGVIPPSHGPAEGKDTYIGLMLIIIGASIILLGWTIAALSFFTARSIARRRRHLFCLIMSGLACVHIPIGTTLGIFTFIVLLRPSVKELFTPTAATRTSARNLEP